jgi:dihydrodipicolinate synthase/N-acetylneuraminate lyase
MRPPIITGLFAAALTPVDDAGRPDLAAFDRLLDVLVEGGVDGVCVGGATGEFPQFSVPERQALARRAAARLPPDKTLLVAIGAASVRHVLQLGESGMASGARALLLPMPFFFRYQQHDLEAFCRYVSSTLRAPCLLYDLPAFSNPIETGTVISLLQSEPHIVGIKDSSGSASRLHELTTARGDAPWSLLVGDDMLLGRGLDAGWNGGISGLASCCPELVVALYRSVTHGEAAERARCEARLAELAERLSAFPTPWGIRLVLRARGLHAGPLPWPLSATRRSEVERLEAWVSERGFDLTQPR